MVQAIWRRPIFFTLRRNEIQDTDMSDPSQYYDETIGRCVECGENRATRNCPICDGKICPWDHDDHVKICKEENKDEFIDEQS
jgi:recombinational DNA repair protein RecR